jgi:hypothetical protein
VVYPVPTNEVVVTESQWYNCFIRNGENAIPKHACPEAKGRNPATGFTLLWAITHSGHFNHWQVSQEKYLLEVYKSTIKLYF